MAKIELFMENTGFHTFFRGQYGCCDRDFFDPKTVLDSSNAKLRMKNYSLFQFNRGPDGGLRKMGGKKTLDLHPELGLFRAFRAPPGGK